MSSDHDRPATEGPLAYGPPPGGFGSPAAGFGPPEPIGPRHSPFAVAALICGLATIPGAGCCFSSLPFAAAGVVLGILALRKIRSNPQVWKGRELAILAIVCCAVGLLLSIAGLFMPLGAAVRSYIGPRI